MAVILAITYQKKLGLPNFSSHSCQVSLTVEIPDLSQAEEESSKLYQLLQRSVDEQIQHVGFMPDPAYGMNAPANGAANHQNGHSTNGHRSNGSNGHRPANGEAWNCTDGQRGFIIRLVNDHGLDKAEVEEMSQQLFGAGVKQLDKTEASQLIEELLEKTGKKPTGRSKHQRPAVRK